MSDLRQQFLRSLAETGTHLRPVPSRSLALLLAELMLAQAQLKVLQNTIKGEPTREQDARWTELEDTIWLRRDEAKAAIKSATGVDWSDIESADL